jgi:hypothetical protein
MESQVSVARNNGQPKDFILEQNYPNPFNPTTTIKYSIPETGHVTLTLFNALGQKIAVLVNETQHAGTHEIRVDLNSFGALASGRYFYQLDTGDNIYTKTMMLTK